MSKRKNKSAAATAVPEAPKYQSPPGVFPIREVSNGEVVFGGRSIAQLMPPYRDLPQEFENRRMWEGLVSKWFIGGLKSLQLNPRPGVDANLALRHIKSILISFEPKHEHKTRGTAWLLSQWFEGGTWS
jgi:hypothetical protein